MREELRYASWFPSQAHFLTCPCRILAESSNSKERKRRHTVGHCCWRHKECTVILVPWIPASLFETTVVTLNTTIRHMLCPWDRISYNDGKTRMGSRSVIFIYSLFNIAVSSSDYIASTCRVIREQRIWMDVQGNGLCQVWETILSRNLPRRSEENRVRIASVLTNVRNL
jgi:hypothetical protein